MGAQVIIVGKGLAGLVCAWQILGHAEGKDIRIDVISDGSGVSPFVHGFNVPLFEGDSIDVFKKDTFASGYGLSDPALVDCLCRDSEEIPGLLRELGLELEKRDGQYRLLKTLGAAFPRVARSGNHTGPDIISRVTALIKSDPRVTFRGDRRALRLNTEDGRVRGVHVYDRRGKRFEYFAADAVLLASGGFCGIYPFSTNSGDIGGDGIAMAYEAGATLTDMEFVQFEPSVALFPEGVRGKSVITTMFYEGAVLRNGRGERFMAHGEGEPGECVSKDVLSKAIFGEITHGTPTPHGGVYFDATGVGKEKLLDSYESYWKRYEAVGMDISREPFEIAPGAHTALGGVVIDTSCATDIRGLFAAGEVTGGLHGANRLGGNAGLETLVFGRRAAAGILAFLGREDSSDKAEAQENPAFPPTPEGELTEVTSEGLRNLRERMQTILQRDLFVVRNGADLERAAGELREMRDLLNSSSCPGEEYGKIRLENDLT